MEISKWNKETRQAYVGTLLYSLLGIVAAILTPFVFIGKLAFLAGDGVGAAGVLYSIVEVMTIVGYVIFFLAVKDLRSITEGEDRKAFGRIYLSIVFDIVGAVFGIFHVGVLSGILGLVSCLLLISAFSSLKTSRAIGDVSTAAISGFGLLFTAEILVLVAICLGWIPVIKIIGSVLKAVAWLLVLLGWKRVAKPVAAGDAPVEEPGIIDTVKEVVKESIEEAKEVASDPKAIVENISEEAKETVEDIGEKLEKKD